MRISVSGVAVCCVSLAGCTTLDDGLNKADRMLAVVASPTVQTVAAIGTAQDPEAALRVSVKNRGALYARNPQALIADTRTVKRDYERLESFLTGKVRRSWGQKNMKLPGRTHYVKYTQNYKSRAIVDFDAGEVTVETVDDKDPRASLRNAVVTTLLTPDDPRAVDLYSDKSIELTGAKQPYLLGLVHDHLGKPIGAPPQAERFADHLLDRLAATRRVDVQGGAKDALFVKFHLVENFESKQAEKYRSLVEKYAARYRISPSLVYAVIRTESNFNPFAVSSAPAYGMMQLVPSSGGREAFRHAKGRDEMPTRDYLFDAENNIELGTAYLNVLFDKQLDYVSNRTSREYCVISAYNTGPSNVLRAFSRDRIAAVNMINSLEPPGVYERLRVHLPYEETRHYLAKVVGYRRQFLSFGN